MLMAWNCKFCFSHWRVKSNARGRVKFAAARGSALAAVLLHDQKSVCVIFFFRKYKKSCPHSKKTKRSFNSHVHDQSWKKAVSKLMPLVLGMTLLPILWTILVIMQKYQAGLAKKVWDFIEFWQLNDNSTPMRARWNGPSEETAETACSKK